MTVSVLDDRDITSLAAIVADIQRRPLTPTRRRAYCPREPGACEFLWIIPLKRFVHEACSRVRRLQHLEAGQNLPLVAAR